MVYLCLFLFIIISFIYFFLFFYYCLFIINLILPPPPTPSSLLPLLQEIIGRLRDGRLNLVVTTELAARGLDIPDLTHVINFELPTDAQHYVHR